MIPTVYTCGGCELPYTSTSVGPAAAICPRCNSGSANLAVAVNAMTEQAWSKTLTLQSVAEMYEGLMKQLPYRPCNAIKVHPSMERAIAAHFGGGPDWEPIGSTFRGIAVFVDATMDAQEIKFGHKVRGQFVEQQYGTANQTSGV